MYNVEEIFYQLMNAISNMNGVHSIGKTGSKELPKSNESDIDIFIFCNEIPNLDLRKTIYSEIDYNLNVLINASESKHWGIMDFVYINEIEICLMYFSSNKVLAEIDKILEGERLAKEDNYFYPIGRCATIKNIYIIYDRNSFLKNIKEKLISFPKEFYEKMIEYHISKLNDKEDFERAVSRSDILFYHFVLDISLDHYLQLLFTLNRCYFPSRKKTIEYIGEFKLKPNDIVNRILKVVELGGNKDAIKESYEIWEGLCKDIVEIKNNV